MKSVSKGVPNAGFTLYMPFRQLRWATPFPTANLHELLAVHFPAPLTLGCTGGDGHYLLRIEGFPSRIEAEAMFNRLDTFLRALVIKSQLVLIFEHSLQSQGPGCNICGKDFGIAAGWETHEDLSPCDGTISLIRPAVIDESQRIVDSGMGMVYPVSRLDGEVIAAASADVLTAGSGFPTPTKEVELAYQAFVDAFSHENIKLRYMSLYTCLEIMASPAQPTKRPEQYQKVMDFIETQLDHYTKVQRSASDQETANQHIAAANHLGGLVGKYRNISISDSLKDLVSRHDADIAAALPNQNPYRSNLLGALKKATDMRGTLAHKADSSVTADGQFLGLYMFLLIAAKIILLKNLGLNLH